MIGRLKGIIAQIDGDIILLDVGGVGYELHSHTQLIASLQVGQIAEIIVQTQMREDSLTLLGFASSEEREIFRIFNDVQGVGTRLALELLSVGFQNVINWIISGDKAALCAISGVGNKLAMRLITELGDKLSKKYQNMPQSYAGKMTKANNPRENEALSALVSLGYQKNQAAAAINKVLAKNENAKIDEIIKLSLRELM
jgi:Holliday junction DNA helicase RuvA